MLTLRSQKILRAVINEFIASGIPVASENLYENYAFGIKPASIRGELLSLTRGGFLRQPHTSGGRVPTEKGYEFFTANLIESLFEEPNTSFSKSVGRIPVFQNIFGDFGGLVNELGSELKLLSVGYAAATQEVYKSGLLDLLGRLDCESKFDIMEVISDVQGLDGAFHALDALLQKSSAPQIFIGKNSPITQSPHLSLVADQYDLDGEHFLIMAVGPTRMDYTKPLKVFKALRQKNKSKKKK